MKSSNDSIATKNKGDRTNNNNHTIQTSKSSASSSSQEQRQHRLNELRVAKQELISGNTKGNVYIKLSKSAVAIPIDRTIAKTRIDRLIIQSVEELDEKERKNPKRE